MSLQKAKQGAAISSVPLELIDHNFLTTDQKVISTGPCAMVRHPMCASAFFWLIGTPLAPGSYWGLLAVLALQPVLIWRLLQEATSLSLLPPTASSGGTRTATPSIASAAHSQRLTKFIEKNSAATLHELCELVERQRRIKMRATAMCRLVKHHQIARQRSHRPQLVSLPTAGRGGARENNL
jgi:hypothetical protein